MFVLLYAHIIGFESGDNYLASFHSERDAFRFSREEGDAVVLFQVPAEMVEDLLQHGCYHNDAKEYFYADGYDAYQALSQYQVRG
jgi:hypothetical protein